MELEGPHLACHCQFSQRCHADVIIRLFITLKESRLCDLSAPPPSDAQALADAAARRAPLDNISVGEATRAQRRPAMQAGHGEPLMVGRGNTRRVLIGGASLCSPGMWTPERRLQPTGVAAKLHEALCFELTKLGNSREGGLEGLLADLTAGRLLESPFSGRSDTAVEGLRR